MNRIEVSRRLAADPASVALLLAGPALPAADKGRDGGASLHVTVGPPVRSSLGFSAPVTVTVGGTSSHGRLRISGDGRAATDMRLAVVVPAGDTEPVRAVAARYLDRLTRAVEARARVG